MICNQFYILHLQVCSNRSLKPWVSEIVSTCISVLLLLQYLPIDLLRKKTAFVLWKWLLNSEIDKVCPHLDHYYLSAKSFQAQHCVYCKLAEEGYKTNSGENVGELKLKIEIFIPLRGGSKNQPNIIGRFIGKDGHNVSRNIIIFDRSSLT